MTDKIRFVKPKTVIRVALGRDLRNAFHAWCAQNDTSMTAEIRRFIEDVVRWDMAVVVLDSSKPDAGANETEGGTG